MGNSDGPDAFCARVLEDAGGFLQGRAGGFDVIKQDDNFVLDRGRIGDGKGADNIGAAFFRGEFHLRNRLFCFQKNVQPVANTECWTD